VLQRGFRSPHGLSGPIPNGAGLVLADGSDPAADRGPGAGYSDWNGWSRLEELKEKKEEGRKAARKARLFLPTTCITVLGREEEVHTPANV
jgi:hypothetical protein